MKTYTISIVIITFNRAAELAQCLRMLMEQTLTPLEILVVDNGSTDGTAAMLVQQFPAVRLIHSPVNLGIPGGRNLGYRHALGDVCVTLDDDAALGAPDALARVAEYFAAMPDLCCVSFEVRDAQRNIIRHYIPRRDRKQLAADAPGASFVGTGHALHRARFLELGGFWEQLNLYFGEEPDLSYRILEAGYTILHSTCISVLHAQSDTARPAGRRIYHGTRNTPWIALKNLPWYSVITLTILSWGYYLLQALRYRLLGSFLRGVVDCLRGIPAVFRQRKCVSPTTIALLKNYSGVYLY